MDRNTLIARAGIKIYVYIRFFNRVQPIEQAVAFSFGLSPFSKQQPIVDKDAL